MQVHIDLVKAFTGDPNLGNSAGVVHDATMMSDSQMQAVAKELGFSESAFVQISAVAGFKVRFFTIKQEVNFCGHATVATFNSLVRAGLIKIDESGKKTVTQETRAGIFEVTCHEDGKVMMAQGPPQFGAIESDVALIAKLLGIQENDLGDLPIQIVSTVTPDIIVPIVSLAALRRVQPDLAGITEYCREAGLDGGGFYLFTPGSLKSGGDFCTRSFDPAVGIDEDAATGVAAGPLGCYANKYINSAQQQFVIEQGFDMGMHSTISVEIANNKVLVGGYAASFGMREFEV